MEERKKHMTSSEQWSLLGEQILSQARQELFLSMRQLFPALSKFKFRAESRFRYLADDAQTIYFNPIRLSQEYEDRPVKVNRAFLHITLHALFLTCFPPVGVNRPLWDLASDIQTEYIIDGLDSEATRLPVNEAKEGVYRDLIAKIHVLSAGSIYQYLKSRPDWEIQVAALTPVFEVDDHSLWYRNSRKDQKERQQEEENRKNWKKEARTLAASLPSPAHGRGDGRQRLAKLLGAASHTKSSYREFLRKFTERREEMKVDLDSFDYGYYELGLDLYGNIPLLEELEYRDTEKIGDFCIVLDTSGSCSGEVLARFLSETLAILSDEASFFKETRIHIIQCDNQIQDDRVLKNRQDVSGLLRELREKQFRVKGYGGTDFRPAFRYVDGLVREKKLTKLRGMLYFTDGYGIYPKERPSWNTCFVLSGDYDSEIHVPGWAIRMQLGAWEDFENEHQES
ncbi:MAG: VWA-like domain-containing protein [Lachnospiraceae bacterium]|jgi:predicted metal-dependent peptidase